MAAKVLEVFKEAGFDEEAYKNYTAPEGLQEIVLDTSWRKDFGSALKVMCNGCYVLIPCDKAAYKAHPVFIEKARALTNWHNKIRNYPQLVPNE